jgi:hypothetical protein
MDKPKSITFLCSWSSYISVTIQRGFIDTQVSIDVRGTTEALS